MTATPYCSIRTSIIARCLKSALNYSNGRISKTTDWELLKYFNYTPHVLEQKILHHSVCHHPPLNICEGVDMLHSDNCSTLAYCYLTEKKWQQQYLQVNFLCDTHFKRTVRFGVA